MQRTNIYLDESQTVALDRIAADEGVSRAEVIRRLIDQGLAGRSTDLEGDVQAIRASAGALRGTTFPARGRGDDDRARHLEQVWRTGR